MVHVCLSWLSHLMQRKTLSISSTTDQSSILRFVEDNGALAALEISRLTLWLVA